jgi:bidirectional [NiFe] hydrogenase diaphorase subunit
MPTGTVRPEPPTDDKRWKTVETRMRRLGNRPDGLIEALHSTQEAFGFLDDEALRYVSDSLGVPLSRVFGVATFYHYFRLEPPGDHSCVVCTGTACYIDGALDILAAIKAKFDVEPHGTTADGRLSLLTGRCFGSCSLAPAAIVDGEVVGRVETNEFVKRLDAL